MNRYCWIPAVAIIAMGALAGCSHRSARTTAPPSLFGQMKPAGTEAPAVAWEGKTSQGEDVTFEVEGDRIPQFDTRWTYPNKMLFLLQVPGEIENDRLLVRSRNSGLGWKWIIVGKIRGDEVSGTIDAVSKKDGKVKLTWKAHKVK